MLLDTVTGKVNRDHLRRDAYLYVRQSSLKQVLTNTESTYRQYDLRGRAIALGWSAEQVIVIDTDQGQSGASAADRDGFQRLVADVGMGRAGIVLGLEVSRLARNNTDWHRLLEICALTSTLILDEDGLYDPCSFNDRLLLGLKGTMSEAELHLLKARLRGGQLSKARRGELKQALPVGFAYDGADQVAFNPDTAVRDAVRHLFAMFTATGSATATVKAFRDQHLSFPRRILSGPRRGEIVWGPLEHSQVLRVLHNPCYAGAFAYGRRRTGRGPDGKQLITVLPREEWTVLITGAHPGYIDWDQFEANQARLAEQAVAFGADRMTGAPREGPALLQGIVLCGKCGRRMTVRYHYLHERREPDYVCQAEGIRTATPICQSVQGADLDDAVAALLLQELTPLAITTALAVADELADRAEQADRIRAQAVQAAQYRADAARRRYLAVDPANRLVADTLEADWNLALHEVAETTDAFERAKAADAAATRADRDKIAALASDFPALWTSPDTPMRERKRMVRLLVTDVTLRRTDRIEAEVRLSGGTTRHLDIPIRLLPYLARQTPAGIVDAIDELLGEHTDAQTAAILNERGLRSGHGHAFHAGIIIHIRNKHALPSRKQRLRDAGLLTAVELAEHLGVCSQTIKRWRAIGILHAELANDKGEHLYPLPGPDFRRPPVGAPSHRTRPLIPTPDASAPGGAV